MSRRVFLLAALSVAAIFFASVVLLQGRSDFTRPLLPKPFGSSSDHKSSSPSSTKGDSSGGSAQSPEDASSASSATSWLKETFDDLTSHLHSHSDDRPDAHDVPDSPALSGEDERPHPVGYQEGDSGDPTLDVTLANSKGYHDEVIDIDIVEVGGSHDEVIAALIHSFGSQRDVKLTLYQALQRYGIADILGQFTLSHPLPDFIYKKKFNATTHVPQILVSTTCEFDSMEYRSQWDILLEKEQTYLFCVYHHADRWDTKRKNHDALLPWARKGLVDFVGLSKHTADFLERELNKWDLEGAKPSVRYYIPVFPVDLAAHVPDQEADHMNFVLQGDFDGSRRNYNKIFNQLSEFLGFNSTDGSVLPKGRQSALEESAQPDVQLHLLGHGSAPKVPEHLKPNVVFDKGLDYLDFYGILAGSCAMLPGFASDDYLDRKASSTVPASLIAGTPIVANQAILDAYTYMPADAVWFQAEGEEDIDVIGRILAMSPAERRAKKAAVREAGRKRIELNKLLAAEWIREALAKVRKINGHGKDTKFAGKGKPSGAKIAALPGNTELDDATAAAAAAKSDYQATHEPSSAHLDAAAAAEASALAAKAESEAAAKDPGYAGSNKHHPEAEAEDKPAPTSTAAGRKARPTFSADMELAEGPKEGDEPEPPVIEVSL